jgi:hypothetical protein
MSSGLCPCGWIQTKGSEWRCAKYLELAIAENKKNKNDSSNKNNPGKRGPLDPLIPTGGGGWII